MLLGAGLARRPLTALCQLTRRNLRDVTSVSGLTSGRESKTSASLHTSSSFCDVISGSTFISGGESSLLRLSPDVATTSSKAFLHTSKSVFNDESASAGAAEARMIEILRGRFPEATDLAVVDISGGCGSMYEVYVEAPDFKGVRMVKQHKMVTEALKAEISAMHGLRISTQASPCSGGGGGEK